MNLIDQDKQHRALALDASQSFIVQAPAGSGKTELLIQRFLTLLNHVKKPEEILAITFTKKAANEMRTRVINALQYALMQGAPESEHAKLTWKIAKQVLRKDQQYQWNIINNPNQLRIQTIDSFCAYLTKQLPLLSHFGSQPDIATSPAALYREAVQEVLSHVEENYAWSKAIAQLLLHVDNDLNKVSDLLVNLLAKRDQWLPYIRFNAQQEEIKAELEKYLALVIEDRLTMLAEFFPADLITELLACARFAADNLVQNNYDSTVTYCRNLQILPNTSAADKKYWLGIAKLLLTDDGTWRKSMDVRIGFPAPSSTKNPQEKLIYSEYKQKITELITKFSTHEDLRLALAEISTLPEAKYAPEQWETLQALLQVLKIAAAQLRITFQQYGQIDFIENTQAALTALGTEDNPTDLALALDYQILHILVDEFQDTSFTQYQLLEKLTAGWNDHDERTLFVVGDPMQSIYRFREAEVGLFIRMRKNGIGNIKLTPLTLAGNFRSTEKIVHWNNTNFQQIFPDFNDIAAGAVSYSASVANRVDSDTQTSISVRGFIDKDEQAQTQAIIHLIQDLKTNNPDESIAILVRSRTHLATIIPALKKAQLSYCAVNIDPLASRQIVQDLLSLTCALLHPADRIAWLAILRAPWCGLTLQDLLTIAGENPHAAILSQLERQEIIQTLSLDGQQRIARIFPSLKTKLLERGRHNLRAWVENTWLLLGGPACLADESELEDAQEFFKLLDACDQQNMLLSLDKLKEQINRLFASAHDKQATVQLMTMHSAKGLEFDTVILPNLDRKMPHDDKQLLMWMERPLANDNSALLLAPIHAIGNKNDSIYEYISRQQKIKLDYEVDRLFYVATTRAKKNLHLFFNARKKGNDEISMDGSFLERLWPLIEKDQENIIAQHPASNEQSIDVANQKYLQRLPANWKNPVSELFTDNIAYHKRQTGFQLPDYQRKIIGTVTHRILQRIAEHGMAWWSATNINTQRNYIRQQLQQQGIIASRLENAENTVNTAIQNMLADPRGQWILHTHQDARAEFALSTVIDGAPINLIIDRTFIDEHGIRWIIDYKTSTLSHQDLEDFLANEQKKYLQQMQKYQQAMRAIEDRPIQLGLYFPALPAWKAWEIVCAEKA